MVAGVDGQTAGRSPQAVTDALQYSVQAGAAELALVLADLRSDRRQPCFRPALRA